MNTRSVWRASVFFPCVCLAGVLIGSHALAQLGGAPAQQQRSPGPKASVVVGKERVPLVSSILDQHCSRMVEPYDVLDNALALLAFVGRASGEILTSGKLTADGVTHRLSKKTREEAMKLNWLPQSVERRFGEMLHKQAVDAGAIVPRSRDPRKLYAKLDALHAELKADLPPSGYAFEIHLRRLPPGQNATAIPGGIIHIDIAVLDNEPLARFALAHEMAHIMKRHETRLTQARIIDALSLRGSAKDIDNAIRNPTQLNAQFLATLATGKAVFARHYSGQELESDACSARILAMMSKRSLKDVDDALSAFLAFLPKADVHEKKNRPGAKPDLIELVSSPIDVHPTPDIRRQNLMTVRADIGRTMNTPAR